LKGFLKKMASENNAQVLIAGLNKTKKLLIADKAMKVYLATDADAGIVSTVSALCEEKNVPVEMTRTKAELCELCGIEVGCAVCVVAK
jgi:large subunit ribosomal protein L7A